MDAWQFDALIRRMTQGGASRRRVGKGLLSATIASLPMLGVGPEVLAKHHKHHHHHHHHHKKHKPLRCSGDSCDGTGGKACGSHADCQCYRWSKA